VTLLVAAVPTREDGRPGRLARRNPVAKLAAATVPGIALLLSLDVVAPAIVLVALLLVLPLAQLDLRLVARRCRPLVLAVALLGVVNAAFAAHPHGRSVLYLGPVHLTTGSFGIALAIALRAAGIALPGVLVLASTDPVDLADSLVQQLRVPAKFAYGTLAAVRLLPLLALEWQVIAMARRARGIDAGRSPLRAAALFASQVFGLLVVAIRRGTRLAAAMDARGFDSGIPRTVARVQRIDGADILLLMAAIVVSLGAVQISVVAGTWRPLVIG
jgi:energy-coupling factor transport system permease protein